MGRVGVPGVFPAGAAVKVGAAPGPVIALGGRLYASSSGWLLLDVPNALANGLFAALREPGAEPPPGKDGGAYAAHVSVMNADEVKALGGPDAITERGHSFKYQLGPVKACDPAGWPEMSKVWFVSVTSPELSRLRRTYGLPPIPGGDKPFHLTFAVRRKGVLSAGGPAKKTAADPAVPAPPKAPSLVATSGTAPKPAAPAAPTRPAVPAPAPARPTAPAAASAPPTVQGAPSFGRLLATNPTRAVVEAPLRAWGAVSDFGGRVGARAFGGAVSGRPGSGLVRGFADELAASMPWASEPAAPARFGPVAPGVPAPPLIAGGFAERR